MAQSRLQVLVVLVPCHSSHKELTVPCSTVTEDRGSSLNLHIFLESLMQTQQGPRSDAEGSSVIVQPETVVQFEGDKVVLDHSSQQLTTMREMKVLVNCIA
jgi:hypothetical protein